MRWWWGKDYSSLRSSPFGPLPLATFSRFRSSRTLIEGSHPSPISANICIAHRGNYIAVVNNGGGGRIRTFEVDDGRFTVCSLWPLGNPTRGNSNFEVMLEMVVGEGLFVASLLTLRAVAFGNVLSLSLESNLNRRFSPFPDKCKHLHCSPR